MAAGRALRGNKANKVSRANKVKARGAATATRRVDSDSLPMESTPLMRCKPARVTAMQNLKNSCSPVKPR